MTKVIAMSGQLIEADGAALLSQGFDGFLSKPFHLQQVIQAVEAALCGQRRTGGAVFRHLPARTSPGRLLRERAV